MNGIEELKRAVESNPMSLATVNAVIALAVAGALRLDGCQATGENAPAAWEMRAIERMSGGEIGASTPQLAALFSDRPELAVESARIRFARRIEMDARPGDGSRILDVAQRWLQGSTSDAEDALNALLGDVSPPGERFGTAYFMALSSSATELFSDRERRILVKAAFAAASL